MKSNKAFLTRNNDQWETPKNIYEYFINKCGMIDFNPLCENYENSLIKNFECDLFCNPPFSNIEPFVDYMISHYKKGYHVIMLLPVRTGTKWFKKILDHSNCRILFFTQRLKFSNKGSCPFDCMIVQFGLDINFSIQFIDRELNIIK